jgi:hypothetical protein
MMHRWMRGPPSFNKPERLRMINLGLRCLDFEGGKSGPNLLLTPRPDGPMLER